LDAFGEMERLRRAHADYFQGVIIAGEATLRRDPDPVVEQYRADQANIRAAVRWSLDVKEGGRVARMAVAMWPFLWIAGLLSEGVEVVQEALLDETALSAAERAHARIGLGMLAFGQGNYDRAAPALAEAIDLYTQLGDVRHVATASVPLGVIQAVRDANGGEDLLAHAAYTFRELDDRWGLAFASLNLGGALLLHDRYVEAIPHLEEGIKLARAVKAEVFLSNALINLGWVYHRLGDLESARKQLRESVQHAAALDNQESLARALDALAAVTDTAGDAELGATLLGAGEGVRHSIGAVVWMTDRASHAETAARLRTALGDTAYMAATESGRGLTIDQVLEMTSASGARLK
jgi:tetratricopeptide (TPR) repeat protein